MVLQIPSADAVANGIIASAILYSEIAGCGVQKPRRITVEYFPKANARLATAGEVATVDFQ
jgi:hypothetical protein